MRYQHLLFNTCEMLGKENKCKLNKLKVKGNLYWECCIVVCSVNIHQIKSVDTKGQKHRTDCHFYGLSVNFQHK